MKIGISTAITRSPAPWSPLRLFAAGAQGVWFDPSDLSTLFQDSAGTTPVTAVGQPVGLMKDKSGRGNHASQATAASRPLLQQDSGGRYVLRLDGTDDFLQTANFASALPQPSMAFIAAALSGATALIGTPSGAGRNTLEYLGTGQMRVFAGGTTGLTGTDSATGFCGTTGVFGGLWNGTGSKAYFNLAETPIANSGAETEGGMYIGRNLAASRWWNGDFYGTVFVNSLLSNADRLRLIRHLADRSGVALT